MVHELGALRGRLAALGRVGDLAQRARPNQERAVVGTLDDRLLVASLGERPSNGLLLDVVGEAQHDQRAAGEVDAGAHAAGQHQRDGARHDDQDGKQVEPASPGDEIEHGTEAPGEAEADRQVRSGGMASRA